MRTESVGPDQLGVVAPVTRDIDTSFDDAIAASVEEYWAQGSGAGSSSAAAAGGPAPIPEEVEAWEPGGDAPMGAGALNELD